MLEVKRRRKAAVDTLDARGRPERRWMQRDEMQWYRLNDMYVLNHYARVAEAKTNKDPIRHSIPFHSPSCSGKRGTPPHSYYGVGILTHQLQLHTNSAETEMSARTPVRFRDSSIYPSIMSQGSYMLNSLTQPGEFEFAFDTREQKGFECGTSTNRPSILLNVHLSLDFVRSARRFKLI